MENLISVIVPVYNVASWLPRCLDSILAQTYKNLEIIIVDDGSSDGSEELCDIYATKYSRIIRCIHKNNGGLSSARNVGIDAANGDFIIFPDPDDWVESNYLEYLQSLQILHKADLTCTGYVIEYDDKKISVNLGWDKVLMSNLKAQEALLISPCMGGFAWNKLYRLDIIKANRLYFLDDVGTTEDLDFAFRYLQFCKTICFDPSARTYHYYQHNGAITHGKFSSKKLQAIHTYEKILKTVDKDSVVCRAAKEEICNTAINLLTLYLNDEQWNETVYQIIRDYIKRYYFDYIKSKRFGIGRKSQAFLANYMPQLYVIIKNLIVRKEKI